MNWEATTTSLTNIAGQGQIVEILLTTTKSTPRHLTRQNKYVVVKISSHLHRDHQLNQSKSSRKNSRKTTISRLNLGTTRIPTNKSSSNKTGTRQVEILKTSLIIGEEETRDTEEKKLLTRDQGLEIPKRKIDTKLSRLNWRNLTKITPEANQPTTNTNLAELNQMKIVTSTWIRERKNTKTEMLIGTRLQEAKREAAIKVEAHLEVAEEVREEGFRDLMVLLPEKGFKGKANFVINQITAECHIARPMAIDKQLMTHKLTRTQLNQSLLREGEFAVAVEVLVKFS